MNVTEKNSDKIYDAICYYLDRDHIEFIWEFNSDKLMFSDIFISDKYNSYFCHQHIIFTYASQYIFINHIKLPTYSKSLSLNMISRCTGIKLKQLKHQMNKTLVKVLKKSNLTYYDYKESKFKLVSKINDVAELLVYKDIMS